MRSMSCESRRWSGRMERVRLRRRPISRCSSRACSCRVAACNELFWNRRVRSSSFSRMATFSLNGSAARRFRFRAFAARICPSTRSFNESGETHF
jgi:hypothetical protein